jgi:hypothetical protein
MTEEEATKQWCPEIAKYNSLNIIAKAVANNIGEGFTYDNYCVGSFCMMWRYLHPEYVKGIEEDKQLSGYCGLAGGVK